MLEKIVWEAQHPAVVTVVCIAVIVTVGLVFGWWPYILAPLFVFAFIAWIIWAINGVQSS